MSAEQITSLVRRKAEAGRERHAARAMTLARALRLTAARQGAALMDLPLSVIGLTEARQAGPALKEALDPASLLLLFEGSGGRAALAVLSPPLVAGLVQHQTMGRLMPQPQDDAPRALSATDAALCAPLVEAVLKHAASLPDETAERGVIAGYRFGLHARSPREACLSLDAAEYRALSLTVDLAGGQGGGTLTLYLPPAPAPAVAEEGADADAPAPVVRKMSENVLELTAELTVALTQLTLPLARITDWKPGDVVPLDLATMGHSIVLDANGRVVSRGTLGQLNGERAVQLEPRPKPHIHPRRRATDRAELDLPDVTATTAERREDAPPPVDVFDAQDALPDMSDLDLGDGDMALEEAYDMPADDRRGRVGT